MKTTLVTKLAWAAKDPLRAILTIYVSYSARNSDKRLNLFERAMLRIMASCLLPFTKDSSKRIEYLHYLQSCGLSALPNRYFEPVPCVDDVDMATTVPKLIAADPGETPDMRKVNELLTTPSTVSEFETQCLSKIAGNKMLGGLDSFTYTYFIRKYKPQLIVEIGSGYSAKVALLASSYYSLDAKVVSIEPFPSDFLLDVNQGENRHELVRQRIQDFSLSDNDFFSRLKENDILFIDSTHVCSVGGDLPVIFCHILPKLRPGVIIHIHDQ